MNTEDRIEQARDLELRVEGMLDLLSIYANADGLCKFPFELEEFIDDNEGIVGLDPAVLSLMDALAPDNGEYDITDLLELDTHLAAMVLVKFATPSRKHTDDDSWTSSWGYYYTHWIAAPTFDEAWAKGVAWAESRHEHDRANPG